MKHQIAILDDYQGVARESADWSEIARQADLTVFREHLADRDELLRRLAPFDVLVVNRERTPLCADVIRGLPRLRLIATSGMRNASIDLNAAAAAGVVVCGTKTLGYPTAELTWGLILGLMRHIPREAANMREGGWQSTVGIGLRDRTLGLIGLGRIGADVARVAVAFGMKVMAWSKHMTAERAALHGAESVPLETLFQSADVISLHLSLGPETRHLVDAGRLALMKPEAIIVNTARGPIIDQHALYHALKAKRIRGAALDVYDEEPLPADQDLRRLDNVLLTPHLGYVTEENYQLTYGQIVENIEAWLKGVPLRVLSLAPQVTLPEGRK